MIRSCTISMVLVASTSAFAATACDPDEMPLPGRQINETVSLANSALENGCMAQVRARVSLRGTTLGKAVFSQSPKWGDVVRIDLGQPSPDRYSQIVCFKRPSDATVQMGIYDLPKAACEGRVAGFTVEPPQR